jgi:hypothetical protein
MKFKLRKETTSVPWSPPNDYGDLLFNQLVIVTMLSARNTAFFKGFERFKGPTHLQHIISLQILYMPDCLLLSLQLNSY